MRKLASIQTIKEINPIEGKEKIGLATVEGWHVIVRYDQFSPGQLCVYIEIDSVLPDKPEFEFLRSRNFRIKTMKMGGVISEGICFPMSILPPGVYNEGDDVTELLGITKYDEYNDIAPTTENKTDNKQSRFKSFLFKHRITKPIAKLLFINKSAKNPFVDEVSKTDEVRIQNIPWIVNGKTKEYTYEVREKIDGQSGTFLLRKRKKMFGLITKYEFVVCSRNMQLGKPDDSSYWNVARKYDIENVLKKLIGKEKWVCIQGECIGPKIQANPYKVKDFDLYCFNLIYPYGIIEGLEAERIVSQYGLKWVPLVDANYKLPDTVDEILDFAEGTSAICDTLREGVVIRDYNHSISFKAVARSYLMKHRK